MIEVWFVVILYGFCLEFCGGEGSGVLGVVKKELENCM